MNTSMYNQFDRLIRRIVDPYIHIKYIR